MLSGNLESGKAFVNCFGNDLIAMMAMKPVMSLDESEKEEDNEAGNAVHRNKRPSLVPPNAAFAVVSQNGKLPKNDLEGQRCFILPLGRFGYGADDGLGYMQPQSMGHGFYRKSGQNFGQHPASKAKGCQIPCRARVGSLVCPIERREGNAEHA